jgi:hypothetical protein
MDAALRITYIGNFEPEFSTENEYAHAFRQLGHEIHEVQEGDHQQFGILCDQLLHHRQPDLILWTRTKGLADRHGNEMQWAMARLAGRAGVPLVGVHLDRWWGLERQMQVVEDPYFRAVDLLFTADGGHQREFDAVGVNHRWLLPGISERWCQPGCQREEYDCDVVFVGGWRDYGHKAWKHRAELVNHLSRWFGDRFLALPRPGQPAIRGLELNDVYWSAKVVVGDSCLVPKVDGSPATHYCSDRVPETLGRGGVLLHPEVRGVVGLDEPFNGRNVAWWSLGDWANLNSTLDHLLHADMDDARLHGIDAIREDHTYTVRARQILDVLDDEGMVML